VVSYGAVSPAPSVNPSLTAYDAHGNEVYNATNNAYLVLASGYVPAPRLTGMTPTLGPASGGTTVTLTGDGFTGATAVDFGGLAAASYHVVSDTSITAVTPVAPAGTVHVSVTTLGGPDVSSSIDQFTFYAQPTVTGLNPNSGPVNGGTTVTITGTGFTGATAVNFGDTPAGFWVDDDATITAISPGEGNPDNVSVTVVTPGGTSAVTGVNQQYTFSTSTGCGGSCVSSVQCARLGGSLNGTMSLTRCAPPSKTNKRATGSLSSGTLTWTMSGATTVMSLNAPITAGQGGCPPGRTEYDLSGSVTGGTSAYTVVGDAITARACVTKSGRLSLVSGTTFGL
jgi:IPT/TIG domain